MSAWTKLKDELDHMTEAEIEAMRRKWQEWNDAPVFDGLPKGLTPEEAREYLKRFILPGPQS